jgi:hypothetical protein
MANDGDVRQVPVPLQDTTRPDGLGYPSNDQSSTSRQSIATLSLPPRKRR